ncbi:hypothetical protein [Brachyspira hampsonii]|nr:hypothetical protein [Brachyspira hampsonii]
MKKIVLMVVLYTLFSFNALYSGKAENAAQLLSYIVAGDTEVVL